MKDIKSRIVTSKATYPLVFNLNVMEEIQEKFGSLDKWGDLTDGKDGEPSLKAIKYGVMLMINEGIDIENEELETKMPFVNEKQVGRIITEIGLAKISELMQDTTTKSVNTGEEAKNM